MPQSTTEIILHLEEQLQKATLNNDVATMDALLAEDWLNINATGTVTNKQQSLELMKEGNMRFVSIVNKEVRIRVHPGVAVVTGHSTRHLDGLKPNSVLFTRVFAGAADHWQVITSQATPISERD